ncbi:interleukin-37 [Microcebus murinus]|uniref:interleukin-37 n=1 Tax=Microcebus murinus TaxID=30608 RepID=UPI003F6BB1C1
MSLLEENSGVKMDAEDWGEDEPWCCSEDPARSPLEPGLSVPSVNSVPSKTFFVLASHTSSSHEGSPILLAVSKGELCLCCDKDEEQSKPSLQLKKNELMKLATQKEKVRLPFVFYRAQVGSCCTLESAAHPGWFVCTSRNSGAPVEVTDTSGEGKLMEFSFQQVSETEMSPSEVSITNAPLNAAFCFPNAEQSPENIEPAKCTKELYRGSRNPKVGFSKRNKIDIPLARVTRNERKQL